MISAEEKMRISDEIDALFENLSIEDVAAILTMQMAAAIAQGSANHEDAADFLQEVRNDIADLLQKADFEAMPNNDEDVSEEPPQPPRN